MVAIFGGAAGRAYLVGQGPDGRHEGAGEAEVGDLEAPFPAHQQVLRLEVPVVRVCVCVRSGRIVVRPRKWGRCLGAVDMRQNETNQTRGAYRCMIPRAWQKARPLKIWKRKDCRDREGVMTGVQSVSVCVVQTSNQSLGGRWGTDLDLRAGEHVGLGLHVLLEVAVDELEDQVQPALALHAVQEPDSGG